MNEEKFHMLIDVLKVLEKHRGENTQDSIIEIIDIYDEQLSNDQKASVLREFLEFKKRTEEKTRRFTEHADRTRMEEFMHPDFF